MDQRFADEATEQSLRQQSSQFSIDINPRLVLSSEEIVQVLISSGVGRYLEFAAIERTYVHLPAKAEGEDSVWHVPCSKKDVFQSKLLGMVEKRQLMKFLQFVADYGETHILGEDVATENERGLSLGRALKRPQNKVNQVENDDGITPYLTRPFQELLEKHFKLSPKLQQVVVYCVALASFPVSTMQQMTGEQGLAAVFRYVASIGRFTGTAFLVPLYGVSEITQSFCRLCAVYGGIYVLRAPIESFLVNEETNSIVGVKASDGGVLRGKHFVANGSYIDCLQTSTSAPSQPQARVLRGIFVLRQSLRDTKNRLMVVIPPEDPELNNPFAIQVIQLDGGAYACPKDYFLVQVSMSVPSDWFDNTTKQQDLVLAVVKRLITSALIEHEKNHPQPKPESDGLGEAIQAPKPKWEDVIAWRSIFSMDHLMPSASTGEDSSEAAQRSTNIPTNAWICEHDSSSTRHSDSAPVRALEIHLESATANACAIFSQICPGEEFLPKSASAEQAEQEEMEDEHDAVLQAAQRIAEQTEIPTGAGDEQNGSVADPEQSMNQSKADSEAHQVSKIEDREALAGAEVPSA